MGVGRGVGASYCLSLKLNFLLCVKDDNSIITGLGGFIEIPSDHCSLLTISDNTCGMVTLI